MWASIQLSGKRWFSWEDAKYLPGLVDYAFSFLRQLSRVSGIGGPDVKECN